MTIALALVLLKQDLVGEVSKSELLNLIRSAGFQAIDSTNGHRASVSDGQTTAPIYVGYSQTTDGAIVVCDVGGAAEFELRRTLSQEDLAKWKKASRLEGVDIRTYLGGRIVLQALFLVTPKTERASLQQVFAEYLGRVRLVGEFVAKRGGEPVTSEGHIGKAPLNRSDRITVIDARDMDYIRMNLQWGESVLAGVIRGWLSGAHPLGVPICFTGSYGHPGFDMVWMGHVMDEAKRERIRRETKGWTNSSIQETFVHLTQRVETDKGIKVGQIITHVENFARKIRSLGIAPAQP